MAKCLWRATICNSQKWKQKLPPCRITSNRLAWGSASFNLICTSANTEASFLGSYQVFVGEEQKTLEPWSGMLEGWLYIATWIISEVVAVIFSICVFGIYWGCQSANSHNKAPFCWRAALIRVMAAFSIICVGWLPQHFPSCSDCPVLCVRIQKSQCMRHSWH